MNAIEISKKLKTALTLACPADVTNLTIQNVTGQVVTLSGSAGATGVWSGGVLEITNGDADKVKVVIGHNAGNTLYLSTPFDSDRKPSAGDTCRLTEGPLGTARIFAIEQNTIRPSMQAGDDYFVHIAIPEYSVEHKGLGREHNSILNQERAYGFQLFVESPMSAGTTAATAYQYATDIFLLSEQVITRVHYFRSLPNLAPLERDAITSKYYIADREGGQKVRLAVIDFSLVTKF